MAGRTRVRIDAKSVWRATLGSRVVQWAVVLAVVLVVVLDAGSIFLTKMSLSDDAKQAGREAARAVSGMDLNSETAKVGYEAATKVTDLKDGVTVVQRGAGAKREQDFEVLSDGRVRLTVVRTAPSLVLGRVSWIARFGVVSVSTQVEKPVM